MFFTYAVILYFSTDMLLEGNSHYEETKMVDFIHYPFFFGIVMYTYEGAPTSLNIRASMQKPEKFMLIFSMSVFFVMICSI